jgi:hypothetical protein
LALKVQLELKGKRGLKVQPGKPDRRDLLGLPVAAARWVQLVLKAPAEQMELKVRLALRDRPVLKVQWVQPEHRVQLAQLVLKALSVLRELLVRKAQWVQPGLRAPRVRQAHLVLPVQLGLMAKPDLKEPPDQPVRPVQLERQVRKDRLV